MDGFLRSRILPYLEPGSTLVSHEDNQNVCAWLHKLTCASEMSKGVIAEIAWLLACYSIQLGVRYITSAANKVADLCSRWSKTTQAERNKIISNYTRLQPHSLQSINIVRRLATRLELFATMDVWGPQYADGHFGWMPPPLTR
jgi:hypothetical protein